MVPRARRFAVALGYKRGFVRKSHSYTTNKTKNLSFSAHLPKVREHSEVGAGQDVSYELFPPTSCGSNRTELSVAANGNS